MRILLADDHELFLKGLELVLKDTKLKPEIVTAKNYNEILEIIAKDKDFDLIMTDLAMPGPNWLESIKKIHEGVPKTPIIILSAVFEEEIVNKTIEIGASGYISKSAPNQEIMDAIDIVLSGGAYIPNELMEKSLNNNLKIFDKREDAEQNKILSPRQFDVIKLISKGYANKQIAYELGITEGTVKLYVTAILKVLDVYNRTGAVMKARELGLIQDE